MKYAKEIVALACWALLLGGGCGGRPRADARLGQTSKAATAEPTPARPEVETTVAASKTVVSDSVACYDDCMSGVGYFEAGKYPKRAVENIRDVIFGSSLVCAELDRFADGPDYEAAERYMARLTDSVKALEWLDFEPWVAMHELYTEWSRRQLERDYIVFRSPRDPAYLYRCASTDSLLVPYAEILSKGPGECVGEVRRLWWEAEYERFKGDSSAMEYVRSRIADELGGRDSAYHAKDRLLWLLSNHLNERIHRDLGEDGTVDFYGAYREEFFKLFDSLNLTYEEP